MDTNTIQLVAAAAGLSANELASVQIAPSEYSPQSVELYQIGSSKKAFDVLSKELSSYASAREDGHTRDFIFAALTNRIQHAAISNQDLRILATNEPMLLVSALRKVQEDTITNRAGEVASSSTQVTYENGKETRKDTVHVPKVDEVCRWVSYVAVDGNIAWVYTIKFNADRSVDYLRPEKVDSKEYDPAYQEIMSKVNAEVSDEMKREGSSGKLGSVHRYWSLKKEKLKARGIDWRSPSELNPNTCYD